MDYNKLYIDGCWCDPAGGDKIDVLNPWSLEVIAQVPAGDDEDVHRAVAAAKKAFPAWSQKKIDERVALVEKALDIFKSHRSDLIDLEVAELGQPRDWTTRIHVDRNYNRVQSFIDVAKTYPFEEKLTNGKVVREAIGVVGLLTPWNYPLGQVVQKVTPALLAGNTAVIKPSQHTPLSIYYLMDAFHRAGLPAGVLNLVTGRGSEVGDALCLHPDVNMISFTGSTKSGREVGRQALSTIKKIALELGGKSPMLCLPGCDYTAAAKGVTSSCFANAGQTCVAFTRWVVPKTDLDKALAALKEAADCWQAGDPEDSANTLGPIINKKQYEKVCDLVEQGVAEGATLFYGAIPQKDADRHVVQPIIFTDVTAGMSIVQEEIFGPVLVVQTYDTVEEGIAIANDTNYGLGAAVVGPEEEALAAAGKIRAGQLYVNNGPRDIMAPFGGYKESGIGREGGPIGFEEYLEIKAVFS